MKVKMKSSGSDRVFAIVNSILLVIITLVAIYPFIYVVSLSISAPAEVAAGNIWLLPKGFSMLAYERVFQNKDILRSFFNSVWYTCVGTFFMVVFTIMAAYPLSRPHFFARKFFNWYFLFTMFFFGGIVPLFQVVMGVGLYGSWWALIIPYLIEIWNLIVCRTSFQSIPESLYEAAKIDGCNEFSLLCRVTLPLSKQIIAILTLFYGISNWNGWFAATLFLRDPELEPLQVVLKRLLVDTNSPEALASLAAIGTDAFLSSLQMKYAIVVVSSLPLIILYPFVQKYFEKGVMIGSIKG